MPDTPLPRRLPDTYVRERLAAPESDWRTEDDLRDSAVLLVLVEKDGVDHVLYNVRRDDLPAHAGQVCFPGGAHHGDEDAVTCALRETREEVGLPEESLAVVARLPDRVSIAGYLVAPFVARLDRPRAYAPDAAEVADVFEVPLPALLERDRWRFRSLEHRRARFRDIPYFDWDGYTVWGLTGIITRDFIRAVADFDPGPRRPS
jgi:8-oxo-dGTP pyrophosphatase MutT (NUDIX family)